MVTANRLFFIGSLIVFALPYNLNGAAHEGPDMAWLDPDWSSLLSQVASGLVGQEHLSREEEPAFAAWLLQKFDTSGPWGVT